MFGDIRHTSALTEYPARSGSGSRRCPVWNPGPFCIRFQSEMFIRWKRRKKAPTKPWRRPRRRSDAGDSLYCVLVESQRINGSPRQKVICYLGSLDEGDREKLWLRVDFWDGVHAKLDQLNLFPRERAKIEQSIGVVVEQVPAEEAAAFKREWDAWWRGLEELIRLRNMISNLREMFEGKRVS